MIKKIFILFVSFVLLFSVISPAFAAEATEPEKYDKLAGTWYFNEVIDFSIGNVYLEVSFTSVDKEFVGFRINPVNGGDINYNYGPTTSGLRAYAMNTSVKGWQDQAARTVVIKTKASEAKELDKLLQFLNANAVKQGPKPPPNQDFLDTASSVITGLLSFFGALLVSLFTPNGALYALGTVLAVSVAIFVIYLLVRLWRRLN